MTPTDALQFIMGGSVPAVSASIALARPGDCVLSRVVPNALNPYSVRTVTPKGRKPPFVPPLEALMPRSMALHGQLGQDGHTVCLAEDGTFWECAQARQDPKSPLDWTISGIGRYGPNGTQINDFEGHRGNGSQNSRSSIGVHMIRAEHISGVLKPIYKLAVSLPFASIDGPEGHYHFLPPATFGQTDEAKDVGGGLVNGSAIYLDSTLLPKPTTPFQKLLLAWLVEIGGYVADLSGLDRTTGKGVIHVRVERALAAFKREGDLVLRKVPLRAWVVR